MSCRDPEYVGNLFFKLLMGHCFLKQLARIVMETYGADLSCADSSLSMSHLCLILQKYTTSGESYTPTDIFEESE